jgi:hypothetical protein
MRAALLVIATLIISTPPAPAIADSTATLTYRDTAIIYPADWPVYDLTKDPTRCVRFDRAAVYLGHPGPNQDCPAQLIGRTTALLVEPNDGTAQVTPDDPDSGAAQAISRNGKVLLTASYGTGGQAAATAVLDRNSLSDTKPTQPGATDPAPIAKPAARTGSGYGFDTCAAPSAHDMHVWSTHAPYRAVAVYIGGINRACGDGNLTTSWVNEVRGWGYSFIPTYVGRQAPCSKVGVSISENPTLASTDGRNAAANAVHNMQRLGFGPGDPVYLDLEQYDGNADCQRSVLRFVSEWVWRLHQSGYVAGVYTSALSDLVAQHNTTDFNDPDAIWIARWDGRATVYGESAVPDGYWTAHRRLHQYRGPHDQQHGGVTLSIDTDYLDGPVG